MYCCVLSPRPIHFHCCATVAAHPHLPHPPRQLQSLTFKCTSHFIDTASYTAPRHLSYTTSSFNRTAFLSSVNMGKATDSPAGGQKTIPADCVSVLLMALGCTGITKAQLEMMSALDGTRTANSFEHQFRSIMSKARELKKRVEDGEKFTPVQPGTKRGGTTTPATSKKRKGDDADDTPTKKPKVAPKPRGKKAQAQAQAEHLPTPQAEDDDDLPEDMEDFIKAEKQWEDEHVV
ncbi:uncharacterized protein EKO05_0002194 [Ascochyta rabiei]|uniref:uncharacterized protein n=1 Tax=Didymella rabiei TaxID=5454 RepID=UPI002207336E|nr:uncharacterized protein EKO05_0002194 [Ascochyta rabiei]UPX11597.1 hypothetical protein EKO05_0002194 [Ascochyta rabiei]